jgi:enterochelin esterase-like enzyme
VFPAFTFEVGLQDMTVNNNTTKTLYNSLTKKGLTCEWVERDGSHDWPFWKGCLPKVLAKVGKSF